jgi:lysophospholipase L1-like esterase
MRKLLALVALFAAAAGSAEARADGGVYVALGDSYTSAPLVPNQYGEPIDCGRSDHNYPSLVAQHFEVDTFIDVSCGSAQTKHTTEPQTGLPLGGTNPPQFNALRSDATLVTVGIGGNDAGLVGVAEKCAELGVTNPNGTACRDHWAPGGNDRVAAKIEAAKPRIAAVLQGIHQRAPRARVAIVGYPDVLPKNGESCYPMVPLSPDDIRYIDELLVRINAMIAGQAALNDADFIDTYAYSGGHDVCKLPPERWFEGLVPTEPAYPLHPNGKGEASMARSAIAALSRPRRQGGGGDGGPVPGAARCLARRSAIGQANIGRIRLGYTRTTLVRRVNVAPVGRTRHRIRYCTKDRSGRVTAVFSSRSRGARAELVMSTASGHGNRGVRVRSRASALARAYPNRRRVAPGLFRASPNSEQIFGVRRGRVAFVAVTRERVLANPRRLLRDLRLALR